MEDVKDKLIEKLKVHDWYYEDSEDHNAYVKGLGERAEIYSLCELFSRIAGRDVYPLVMEYIPEDSQEIFVSMLINFATTRRAVIEGKL